MKTAIHALFTAWILGSTLTLGSATALAQTPEERAGARSAAQAGLEAYNSGKYSDSLDLFTRAENLVHAPTHLLYIARSNAKVGKLVRAQEAYEQLAREKLAANAPQPFRDAQQSAEQELAALISRIPKVTVKVKGGDGAQATVTMDGKAISAALVGIPFPADPGMHQFSATAPGFAAAPVSKALPESSRESVELQLVPSADSPAPVGGTSSDPAQPGSGNTAPPADGTTGPVAAKVDMSPSTNNSGDGLKIAGYVGLGLGAVGIGAGTVFLVGYLGAKKDADDAYNSCVAAGCKDGSPESLAVDDLDSTAKSKATVMGVTYALGGVFAATGITLLVIGSSQSNKSSATLNQPTVRGFMGPGSFGLSGQF